MNFLYEYVLELYINVIKSRVGLDIRPDIETIRIPDIRLIYNAGYPVGFLVFCRISVNFKYPDIRYPAKKISDPTLNTVPVCLSVFQCVCWFTEGRGDIRLFIKLVPKVLQYFLIRCLNNFWDFN